MGGTILIPHEKIKAKAKEFTNYNGNVNISNKELLIFLLHEVSSIKDKYVSKTAFNTIISILTGLIMFLITKIFIF